MPPTTAPSPRSLSQWLTHLQPRQLPVDPRVREALLAELAGGTASSARFAELLRQDPPQVLIVLREANAALRKYERGAATVEHAITLLGTDRVRRLLLAAPALDPGHPNAAGYRQALLRSQHAAWQARLWAEGSGRWHADDLYWTTLLAGAPLWLLWLEGGALLRQLLLHRARGGDTGTAAQRQILGTALAPLCAALAQAWQLPEVSQQRWQPASIGTPRQWLQLARAARLEEPPLLTGSAAHDLSHQPALIAALANALAAEADWDWHSRQTLRLLRIAATCCRRPLATVISYGHGTAAALSRAYAEADIDHHPDTITPAARLLCHWREAQRLAPEGRGRALRARAPDPRQLTAALQRLQQPQQLQGPRDALALATQALADGIGLQRVVVLQHRVGARELQALFSSGCDEAPALAGLRLPTANSPLLAQLLQKPACLAIDAGNHDRLLPHLPAPLRAGSGVDSLLLMSVFAGQTPLALIYADNAGAAIDATQLAQFKRFCQQLSATLGPLLRRQAGPG